MEEITPAQAVESLADKSVCIVGNASSLLAGKMGKHIDEYDVVIRHNLCVPSPCRSEAIGTKTTIISGSCVDYGMWDEAGRPDVWLFFEFSWSKRSPYRVTRPSMWPDDFKKGLRIFKVPGTKWVPDHTWMRTFEGTETSSGLNTVHNVMKNCRPASVCLVGFDFFKSRTWSWTLTGQTEAITRQGEMVGELASNGRFLVLENLRSDIMYSGSAVNILYSGEQEEGFVRALGFKSRPDGVWFWPGKSECASEG